MPTLPDKFALGQAPSGDPGRAIVQLPGNSVDTGALAADMLGGGLKQISAVVKTKAKEDEDYEVQKALIDFDLAQEKRLDDAKRQAAPEARDFTSNYRGAYDQGAREFMTRVPDRLKPKLDEILVKRGAAFEKRAYDFELAERDRYHIDDINTRLNEIYNDSTAFPDRHTSNADRGLALIRSSKLTARAKAKAEREFLDRNEEFAVRSLAERYAAEGRDVGEIIEQLRKVPRGSWRRDPSPTAMPGTARESTINIIKRFEGDKDNGWDVRQYSGPYGVKRGPNERLTLEEADRRLRVEVAEVEKALDEKIKVPIADSQRAALVSLFYNIGTGKGRVDQVARMINAGELDKVPAWIRQYERDSDGNKLPGLVRRRAEEADLFRRGSTLGSMPPGEIERVDLPPPPKTVNPETPKPKIDPETGQPIREIGADQSDLPKDGALKPVTTDAADEPFEADDVPYRHLSPLTRRKLINVLRGASRAQVTAQITDEIERVRLGREPARGPDGLTAIERAKRILPPVQYRKLQEQWQEADLEFRSISPLRSMPIEDMYDHVLRIMQGAEQNEESLRAARKVRDKAEREIEKIRKLRDTDPVRSVNGFIGEETDERRPPLPNTAAAMQVLRQARAPDVVTGPDGTPQKTGPSKSRLTPQQQWELIFDARLKDQELVMPGEPERHRIIDRNEAQKLLRLPKDAKNIDRNRYRQLLGEAAARAEKTYGAKYAKRVMQEAIAFQLSGVDEDHKNIQAGIVRKMISGEPISATDIFQMQQIEQLQRSGLRFGSSALVGLDRVGRGIEFPVAPAGDPTRPAIGQTFQPTQRQADWLRQNPDGWQAFDEKFGKGASSRILGSDEDPAVALRATLPKAKPGSPEARAADAVKKK